MAYFDKFKEEFSRRWKKEKQELDKKKQIRCPRCKSKNIQAGESSFKRLFWTWLAVAVTLALMLYDYQYRILFIIAVIIAGLSSITLNVKEYFCRDCKYMWDSKDIAKKK